MIGRDYTYAGEAHRWAKGLRVRVIRVWRGEQSIEAGEPFDGPQPADTVEFARWVDQEGRFSWATSDATWGDLRSIE